MCSNRNWSQDFLICTAACYVCFFWGAVHAHFFGDSSDGRLSEEFVFSHCRRPTVYCFAACQNRPRQLEHARTFLAVACHLHRIYPCFHSGFDMAALLFWQPRDTSTRTEMFKSIILVVCACSALGFWQGQRQKVGVKRSQRAQYPLTMEYTLNGIGILNII